MKIQTKQIPFLCSRLAEFNIYCRPKKSPGVQFPGRCSTRTSEPLWLVCLFFHNRCLEVEKSNKNTLFLTTTISPPSAWIVSPLLQHIVDHNIPLHHLHSIGLSETTLCFYLYLTGRTDYVTLGWSISSPRTVSCGVPQGFVLGLTLFTIYLLPLGHLIQT